VRSLADLTQDAEILLARRTVWNGGLVVRGAYDRMQEVWAWAKPKLDMTLPVYLVGHSLGGTSVLLAPFVVVTPVGGVYAFEPPRAADRRAWTAVPLLLPKILVVAHEDDPLVSWPFVGDVMHPPQPILWLKDRAWSWVYEDDLPGAAALLDHDGGIPAHDIDAVIAAIATEASAPA
jgi:hypothetical protein